MLVLINGVESKETLKRVDGKANRLEADFCKSFDITLKT